MKKNAILIILIIIILFLDFYLFFNYIYIRYKNKNMLETTDIKLFNELSSSPFKIDKIILYSSAYAKNKNTNFQNINWLLDIYQYTDIAIYIDSKESIKSLSITNPVLKNNSHKLYYLDGYQFGTGNFSEDFEINDTLNFSILNFDNSDNSIKYNTPIFFADSSNPITLKFTNTLFKNFSIPNSEKLIFNGTLLSKTPIKLESLMSNLSICINITTHNNNNYEKLLNINIPIKDETSTIFDGHIYVEEDLNIPFFINN